MGLQPPDQSETSRMCQLSDDLWNVIAREMSKAVQLGHLTRLQHQSMIDRLNQAWSKVERRHQLVRPERSQHEH
jgi:ribosomal protein S13